MKQKKKSKNRKLENKIIKQHLREKPSSTDKSYTSFSSVKDVKEFILHNLDFIVLLFFIIIGLYFNSLKGAFVSDDIPTYVNNPVIKDIKLALKTFRLQEVIYALNHALFELNPIPLHIFSVLLHFVTVVCFFLFTANLFPKKVAMLSAILFAVHPLNTETVDWISANNYLLFGVFAFLSALTYIMYKNSNNSKPLYISALLLGLVLMTTNSPQFLTIFFVIIILDQFLLEDKINLKNLKTLSVYLIPIILFLTYYGLVTGSRAVGRIQDVSQASSNTSYLISLPYSFYMPLRLMMFPDNLTLYHDAEPISKLLMVEMWITMILFIIITAIAWKKNRKVTGLLLIIPISYIYMLSPVQISWFFAERYVYFATAIFTILLAILLLKIEKKVNKKNTALILVILIAGIYSVKTFVRNGEWKTRKSLWESTARVVPLSARAYNNLGDVYAKEGNSQTSIQAFERAIELKPNYSDAIHNLGLQHLKEGNLDEAEEQFKKSLELNPNIYQSYTNLAYINFLRKDYAEARELVNAALQINPEYSVALRLLTELDRN